MKNKVIIFETLAIVGLTAILLSENANNSKVVQETDIKIRDEKVEEIKPEVIIEKVVETEYLEDTLANRLPDYGIAEGFIGFLFIPTCDIEAYIKYGSSMNVLKDNTVGEFECAENIGVGNYSLLGHSNEVKDYVFSTLEPNIEIGDSVYVVKNKFIYEFIVDSTDIVEPEDVWILEHSDEPVITIMCCTENGNKRFVVKGLLKRMERVCK